MKILKMIQKILVLAVVVSLFLWVFVFNWSFVFKKKIVGEVVSAEKVNGPISLITNANQAVNPQTFSFSVAIKDRFSEEIFMASSEDRQWAAVNKGNCVIAAYFPYPPWQLNKGGTSHNARLLRNYTSCSQVDANESIMDKIKFFFLL